MTGRMSRTVAVRTFLSQGCKPVELAEMATFWKACTEQERDEYSQQAATALGVELESK
jgi:hypothetical protein